MHNKNGSTDARTEQPRRGRGRPRKADAMTDAERAARYRARKKEKMRNAPGGGASTPNPSCPAQVSQNEIALSKALDDATKRINDLSGALDVVVSIASKGKLIPADVLAGLYRLLSSR